MIYHSRKSDCSIDLISGLEGDYVDELIDVCIEKE